MKDLKTFALLSFQEGMICLNTSQQTERFVVSVPTGVHRTRASSATHCQAS
jgi:hypothetical protein